MTPELFGILNLTRDSFSDGGSYLEPADALAHARRLVAGGAAILDVGAESTHPDSEDVDAEEELRRLRPVVETLLSDGLVVSIDTCKPEVMAEMAALGVHFINDVDGFRAEASWEAVADSDCRLVAMHSLAAGGRADRDAEDELAILERIETFATELVQRAEECGVARERLILDPGMGFFLGSRVETSCTVLAGLPRLRALGLPLLVSTSRKSFLGQLTGREVAERGPATLASELHAARSGVDYIRTHDPAALTDALTVWRALDAAGTHDPT
ncbi:MAG: dihydropteroate synthase [Acidobacteriota bacterium]